MIAAPLEHARPLVRPPAADGAQRERILHGPIVPTMLRRMREDMDRLFEGFWRHSPMEFAPPWTGETAMGLWNPHVDVREHDGMLSIAADLPGVKSDDVNVEITPEGVHALAVRDLRRLRWSAQRSHRAAAADDRVRRDPRHVDRRDRRARAHRSAAAVGARGARRRRGIRLRALRASGDFDAY